MADWILAIDRGKTERLQYRNMEGTVEISFCVLLFIAIYGDVLVR